MDVEEVWNTQQVKAAAKRYGNKALDIVDTDYKEIRDVDQKLVRLCVEMNGDLVTNDYNLQKIAQLRQITVINFNELADALKPVVYVGEIIQIHITKQGKEQGQGVGFLKDGTMVVVDSAQDLIGQHPEVVITNILQNPSGRLVFGRVRSHEPATISA